MPGTWRRAERRERASCPCLFPAAHTHTHIFGFEAYGV